MAFTVLLVGVIPAAPWRLRIAASATTGGADLAKAARESVRLAFPGLPRLPMKIALANGVPVDLDKTLEEQGIESGDTLRVRFYDPSLDAVDTDGGCFSSVTRGIFDYWFARGTCGISSDKAHGGSPGEAGAGHSAAGHLQPAEAQRMLPPLPLGGAAAVRMLKKKA